jgi:hypothetical protein
MADAPTNHVWDSDQLAYAKDHLWAVLATGRSDGSPQQSMVGYVVDEDGRFVVSAKAYTSLNEQQRTVIRITPTKTIYRG